jgi:hypothetical protein
MKILLIFFISMFLVGCSTTQNLKHQHEIMRDVKNTKNDGIIVNLDTRGNPYNKVIYNSTIDAGISVIIKTELNFVVDKSGFVYIDPETRGPVLASRKDYVLTDKGWIERFVVPVFNTAVQATTLGLIGRSCRGCGGGSGTQVLNYNNNDNDNTALSESGALVNSANEVSVGCTTNNC